MELQFIYKNNQKKYKIADGANISMSYNEDLSHGIIIIRESEKVDIEPYDEIIIYGLDYTEKLYMLVDSYVEKETRNRTGDKVYTYQINIMSQTKLLENKVLPSLSITPKTNGNLRIIDYLNRYNDLYGQKVRTFGKFMNKFVFDVGDKFNDVCPELQFNNPTFRECLTQLMMVKNCIPIVQNNVISYIDLSKKQRKITDESKIAYTETSQSSEDYISSLRMNMKNVIQDDNLTIATEYIGFRNNNTIILNDSNCELYTQYPIYDLISLEMIGSFRLGETQRADFIKQNLLNINNQSWVKEKSEYETLEISEYGLYIPVADYHKYQNTTLYWTRGSNLISGFNTKSKETWMGFEINTYKLIINGIMRFLDGKWKPEYDTGNYQYTAFKITYKTKANLLAKIGKGEMQTTEREAIDNQTQNYVNAYTQGLLEYSKANRLGNKLKTKFGRYERKDTNMPVIGDYFGDNEIIYKADYQINKNSVDATYYTCPNYVLRNYFTGVQSKLRSWKIVDDNEAFEREENYKEYIELDYVNHPESIMNMSDDNFKNLMPCLLGSYASEQKNLNHIVIYPRFQDEFSGYYADVMKNEIGNSVVFSCGYTSNRVIERAIEGSSTGGYKQNTYYYTDKNGNCKMFSFMFLYNYKAPINIPDTTQLEITIAKWEEYKNEIFNYQKKQPLHLTTLFDPIYSIDYFKDNKEIMRFNFQYEFCSNQENIIIGDEFMNMLKGINRIDHNNIKAKKSTIEPDRFNLVIPSGATEITLPTLNVYPDDHCFELINSTISDNEYCYIYNQANNKVILTWKGGKIYGNLLQQRNKGIYERVGNDLIKKRDI